MKKWSFLLCFLGSFVFAEIITLKNGTVLHGVISEYTEEHIILKTFDEREYTIQWKLLHHKNKEQIQEKLGLVTSSPTVDLIKGVVIYLRNGATVRGRIISRGDLYMVKTKNGSISIPKNNILNVEKQKVAITDVYSLKEIYDKVQKKYDFDKADDQWKLANFLITIGAVEQAKKHFDRAQELNPEYAEKSEKLAGEFDKFSSQQEEIKIYRKYQLHLRAGRYQEAKDALEELRSYKTKEEIDEHIQKIAEKEKVYYNKNVALLFFRKISSSITSLSLNRKITLAEAKEQLLGTVYEEASKEVMEKYSLSESQLETYLKNRDKSKLKSYNFGRGTFTVGLGRDQAKVENYAKIESFIKARRVPVVSQKITPEEWWQKESSSQKREWLQAFLWLNKFEVEKENWKICPQCRAKGFIKSGRRNVTCPHCQGLKFERLILVR